MAAFLLFTAAITDISYNTGEVCPEVCPALPLNWTLRDIGGAGAAGSRFRKEGRYGEQAVISNNFWRVDTKD